MWRGRERGPGCRPRGISALCHDTVYAAGASTVPTHQPLSAPRRPPHGVLACLAAGTPTPPSRRSCSRHPAAAGWSPQAHRRSGVACVLAPVPGWLPAGAVCPHLGLRVGCSCPHPGGVQGRFSRKWGAHLTQPPAVLDSGSARALGAWQVRWECGGKAALVEGPFGLKSVHLEGNPWGAAAAWVACIPHLSAWA